MLSTSCLCFLRSIMILVNEWDEFWAEWAVRAIFLSSFYLALLTYYHFYNNRFCCGLPSRIFLTSTVEFLLIRSAILSSSYSILLEFFSIFSFFSSASRYKLLYFLCTYCLSSSAVSKPSPFFLISLCILAI